MAVRVSDNGGLSFSVLLDDSDFDRIAGKVESRIAQMSNKAVNEGDKMTGMFKNAALAAGAFFSLQAGKQLIGDIINVRGEFQKLEIAFTTMLGSKEKADKLTAEIVRLAAITPFGLQEVAGGAKQLLAYGFAADSITDNVTRLGNVAAGVGSQIGDLIYLYGTLRASGRVTAIDLQQFAGRGIPIYDQLAKVLSISVAEVREFASAGKIGFPEVEKAFKNMTDQGGMFYNLMEAQSASLSGQVSNLADSFEQMLNEIGQGSEGVLAGGIGAVSYLIENYKEVGKILAILITTYGTYRAALIVTTAIERVRYAATLQLGAAEARITTLTALRTAATNLLAGAQARLNAVMAANPVGLVFTAVAALGSAMYFLSDRTSAAEKAQKRYNEALEGNKKLVDDIKQKTSELAGIVNDETQTKTSQIIAYQQLQALYKGRLDDLTLEAFKLKNATDQQKRLNIEISKFSLEGLKAEYEKALSSANKLATKQEIIEHGMKSTVDNTMSAEYKAAADVASKLLQTIQQTEYAEKLASMSAEQLKNYYVQQLNPLQQQVNEWEKVWGKIKRNEDGTYQLQTGFNSLSINGILQQFNLLIGKIATAKGALDGTGAPKTVQQYKEANTKLEEELNGLTDTVAGKKRGAEIQKELESNKKKINEITGVVDKSVAASTKKATANFKRAAEDRKQFLESLTEAETRQTIAQKAEGEKQVAEIQDRYAKLRKAAEDAGFTAKNAPGVFTRIDNLEKKDTGFLQGERDADKVVKELDKQKQLYSDFEDYKTKTSASEAQARFNLEGQYLDKLLAAKVNAEKLADGAVKTKLLEEINSRIADADKETFDRANDQRAQAINDLLTFSQKKYKIEQENNKRIAALGKDATAEQIAQSEALKNEQLKQLSDTEANRISSLSKFADEVIFNSKEAVKAYIGTLEAVLNSSDVSEETKATLRKQIEQLKDLAGQQSKSFVSNQYDREIEKQINLLNDLTEAGVLTHEQLSEITNKINQLRGEQTKSAFDYLVSKFDNLSKFQEPLQQLGETLASLNGGDGFLAGLGGIVQGLAGQINNVTASFKNIQKIRAEIAETGGASSGTMTDAFVQGAKFIADAIGSIVNAARERKKAEEEYYRAVIGLQNNYNLSLIEQERIQSQLKENVFLTNYVGRAKDAMQAAIKANQAYQKSIEELAKGQAKVNQKDALNGAAAGKLALQGAAAGAVIGTVVPVIGTAVGAVVGGLAGLLAGLFSKKKKDVFGGLMEQYPELVKTSANGLKEIDEALAKQLISQGLVNDATKQLLQNVLDNKKAYEDALAQIDSVVKDLAGNLGNDLRNSLVEAFRAGSDSAKAFQNDVNKVLENILSNILFNAVFDEVFTNLQKQLSKDLAGGSATDITETLAAFFKTNGENINNFNALLEQAKKQAKDAGLDIFGKGDTDTGGNTMSKSIKAITQDQADILGATTKGIQLSVLTIAENNKKSLALSTQKLEQLNKIQVNTFDTVAELKLLNTKIKSASDANRAAGGGLPG